MVIVLNTVSYLMNLLFAKWEMYAKEIDILTSELINYLSCIPFIYIFNVNIFVFNVLRLHLSTSFRNKTRR